MARPITTEQVKELRDATGISVMQCRKALEEADGDMKKALAILKKTSSEIALKKGSRAVLAGSVSIKSNGSRAVLVTLLCETDFVARNDDFIKLLDNLAEQALSGGIEKMRQGAKEQIDLVIQKTGENIQLGETLEVEGSTLGTYLHNGKIGVIVSLEGGSQELAKDVAMHAAAMKPEYITEADISDDARKTMQEVFEKELAVVEKPEEIKRKMLEGKMASYFKEKTLVDQAFIKDADMTVGKLLEKSGAKILEVKRFAV